MVRNCTKKCYNTQDMIDKLNQEQVAAKRAEYLRGLYDKAIGGDIDAGDELSKIALGGFQQARDLVGLMDTRLSPNKEIAPVIPKK